MIDQCEPALAFTTLGKNTFEKIVGKGENAGNQHFSFSHNVFYPFQNKYQFLKPIYFVICKCSEFGQSRILFSGKGLSILHF